ncbi:M13 family metallopeptidase [Nocardia sp. NBC_01009]|uniref:M13 family metallopeptidase n=1 Tax=Nocardia sp. NBC_01009 TaxID=2975996 RepID=UPI0038691E80|nr:M13 family metallopeptidase [Nocardia sp. NBC_01009]
MSSSAGPFRFDRRAFLIALGVIPATAVLASCSRDAASPPTGVDMSGADQAIRPQDDLYRHVNGTWLRDYQLPADRPSYTSFDEVRDRVQQQLREIVDSIRDPKPGSAEQQIRDLYDARLDLDEIERLGSTPLADLFAAIDGAATKADLARVMGALPVGGLIGLGVAVDQKNSGDYIAMISQSGIDPTMGEQYYRKPEYAEQLAAYRTYLERIAAGADFLDPSGTAQRVLALETRIAAGYWDDVRLRNPDATYNLLGWTELPSLAPQFDWEPWLAGSTDRPRQLFDKVVVGQPSFVAAAGQLWAEVDIASWREYLRMAVVKKFAAELPEVISAAAFDFIGKALQGQQQRQESWKDGIDTVDDTLGQPLGKLYVGKYFPPIAKERAQALVADLMAAYRDNFTNSSWMSPPTRAASIAKLDKIVAKIGYPDTWIDYSGLHITRGKLIESLRAAETFERKRMFARLGTPVDRAEWAISPQTVNAMYDPSANEISFPAAILQPPFFDKDAQAAVNYGAIGAIIGHEIGHGFDDQGSEYDADGNLRDWWTPADRAAFDAKTAQLIAQYNALVPVGLDPRKHVDGALTVGENLADLRGLSIALAALRIAGQHDGTGDPDYPTLFLSWARIWRDKSTEQRQQLRLAMDVHAPNEFRCNQVIRNIPEFYRTFGVTAADRLFLPEDQRVTL